MGQQSTGKKSNVGKGKATKAIHFRKNGWGIGMYDAFTRNEEIVVGQLCHIDMDTGWGVFRGFVLNDIRGTGREGQFREWGQYLTVEKPSKISPTYIQRYERFLREEMNGND